MEIRNWKLEEVRYCEAFVLELSIGTEAPQSSINNLIYNLSSINQLGFKIRQFELETWSNLAEY